MNRREIFFLVVIMLFGTALRLYQIGAQSLWLDELFSVMVARRDWIQVIMGTVQGDTNPPLYNLLLHVALQFGSDETAARVVSFLFSIATIPLFYALARQLFDIRTAMVSGLILAFNPLHIFYAQEARMYAMLAFLALAAMYFFLRAWRNGRSRDWAIFAIATSLAFYTHSLAFLNLLALDVFALTQRDVLRARWRRLVFAHLAIVILLVPWFFVFTQQAYRVQTGFWGAFPPPTVPVMTSYLFLFSSVVPKFLVPVALFAGLALIAFMLLALGRASFRQSEESAAVLFGLIVFIVPLVALYALSFLRPIYIERTLLPASLGLYLLLGWTIVRADPRGLNFALGVIVLLVTMVALMNYYFNPETRKPAMREAAAALAERFQANDVIAHTSDSSALAFTYYQPSLPNRFLAGDPDYSSETTRGQSGRIAGLVPENWQTITMGHPRVWLVVALDHNEEYQRSRVAETDARWTRVDIATVHNISLVLYEVE